jgi:hypothetical protein
MSSRTTTRFADGVRCFAVSERRCVLRRPVISFCVTQDRVQSNHCPKRTEPRNRMLRVMGPLRQGLDTKATVFTWSITTDIRANLLSARSSKGTRRDPDSFLGLLSDHDDTGVTELTDRICRVRRPVDNPCTASTGRPILIAWMGSAGVNPRIGRDRRESRWGRAG